MVIISPQDRIIKTYRKKLTASLPCSGARKEEMISSIELNIRTYFDEHPDASEKEIYKHFGTPDEITNEYLHSLEGTNLQKKFKKKRTIFCIVFAIALVIAVLVGSIAIVSFEHAMRKFPKESYVVSEGITKDEFIDTSSSIIAINSNVQDSE